MLSFGLRLYRSLYGVSPGGALSIGGQRPQGRLIWLHAPHPAAAAGFGPLIAGLKAGGLAEDVLLTCAAPGLEGAAEPPAEDPALVAAFLDHWRPDLCLWAGGDLRPVLLSAVAARRLPTLLVNGTEPNLQGGWPWPRLLRSVYAAFDTLFVQDEAAAQRWKRSGASPRRVEVLGRLDEGLPMLPVPEAERVMLARLLGSRPVWLAVGVPEAEEDAILRAHEDALRTTHRLLLILVPASAARIPTLLDLLPQRYSMTAGYRAAEEDPDEETQVYLADDDEPGLWYRLAPFTWAGGTLCGQGAMRHPWEAAAAGSALLHGPYGGRWQPAFDRLRAAGGARLVASPAALGEAVGDLLSPERCARLAHAAWEVTSAGSDATAAVLARVAELLSEKEASR